MQIELISYKQGLTDKNKLNLTTEIVNNSESDLILFSGHSIGFVNDVETLRTQITNKHVVSVLELQDINSSKISNCLYFISKGELISLNTNQIFTQSNEIEGNFELARRLLHEFETNRVIRIKGYNLLVIQCGEINILKNIQGDNNRVEFRCINDIIMTNRFLRILDKTDMIFNPIHTPMGNQGKMKKRREFLSLGKKYYFSTSNTKENSSNLSNKSLQYALYNGLPLKEIGIKKTDNYVKRLYAI